MEKDFGSWFQHQHIDWRLPNLNSSCASFELGQNTVPSYMNPWNYNVSTNGTQPVFAFPGLPCNNSSQSNEPRGWFYCLPRYRQAFDPILNSVPKEKPTSPNENFMWDTPTNTVPGCPQKRFLVFDQSGDRTTLIFSSGMEAPVQYLPSWSPKIGKAFDSNKEDPATKKETNHLSMPVLNDDVQSEMREDSEELDALLHCDDDDGDYFEDDDDEVTSTGHSPSSLTDYDDQERSDESEEEVASSSGPTKRQKLVNGCYEVPSLGVTSSSVKVNRRLECEDDAESSCGESKNPVFRESGSSTGENPGSMESISLIGSKRLRKERIRTSVSILQSIVPGGMGKDKDAIVVLGEAIDYLKSLKVKAEALGFDTL